jgi:hypothetical protein
VSSKTDIALAMNEIEIFGSLFCLCNFLAYRSICSLFYFYLELTLKMTQIFLFHSWLKLVISVEIMALRLRENKNINGIKVKIDDKAHIIKISQ